MEQPEDFKKAVETAKTFDIERRCVFDDANGTIYMTAKAFGEYWLYKWLPGQSLFHTVQRLENEPLRFTNGKNLVNLD